MTEASNKSEFELKSVLLWRVSEREREAVK